MIVDTDKLISKLEDMADRKTRYNYGVGDYWNALGDAAEALKELKRQNVTFRNAQKSCEDCDAPTLEETKRLRDENAQLREHLARAHDRLTEYTRTIDGILEATKKDH